mgnify:CR=1 FL=1
MKPNFTNAFFQKTRCLRTVLRRAVVCMLLLGTTVVHAQERKITVDTRQEVTLVQLFRQVEASSDYLFNYKDQDVADIRVSVKVADASIQEVMDLALARTSLTYTVKGRHVIIGQSAARSAGTPLRTDSRPVALTGRVTDEKGMPFVGVTVIQEGTTNGCVTDADGNYRISVPVGASVSFSYIGYKTQRTHVGVQTRVDIRLEPSDISLETVVVTALGIKKAEKSLGYSLQQVNSDAFDKVKTDNPINALNGKVAGLTVNTRAGILEDPPIKLRGETPIYVINGTPVTYYRGVSSDDIESITVLKGPQAAVLYGSRGANGAILITTKTGDDIGEKTEITPPGTSPCPSSRASTVRAISASIPTLTARAAAYTTVCGPGARNSTRRTPPRRAVISRPYSTTARSTPRRGSGFRRLSSPTRTISAIFCNRASPRATTSASPINSRRGRSASVSTSSTAGGRLPTPISSASASIWRPTTTSPGSCISMPA